MPWDRLANIAIFCMLSGSGASAAAEFQNELREPLEKAERFELLSINPDRRAAKISDDFHGWNVLGRTMVEDADTRRKLVAAYRKGVEDNDGIAAKCFNPRHGIRVTLGERTVDLVICFECLQTRVYADGKERLVLTTSSPEPVFDSALKSAKVPLARELRRN